MCYKPWLLWMIATAIAFTLQFSGEAGTKPFATLAVAMMCSSVIIIGLKQKVKIEVV